MNNVHFSAVWARQPDARQRRDVAWALLRGSPVLGVVEPGGVFYLFPGVNGVRTDFMLQLSVELFGE